MVTDRVQYKCTTVEELAAKEPESFDCVVASEVIEHVTDKDTFISASAQLVKVSKDERKKRIKKLILLSDAFYVYISSTPRELKQTMAATATKTPPNKRFNE